MIKLAIITTHPIQYNAPLFKMLHERGNVEVKVFYTWEQAKEKVFDPTFGHIRTWDIPLLEGYNFTFVKNISTNPGSHHFKGIINPTLNQEILQFNPSAVLVYGWNFSSNLKAIRFFYNKIPVWFRGDSTLLDEPKGFNIKKIVRRYFLKWLYKHVDIALSVGSNNTNYFLQHGLKQNQIVVASHAIDNNRFSTAPIITNFRTELNIKEEEIVLLFVGKFEHKKNPLLLLQSFINASKPNTHLVFVGNGVLENELKQQANSNNNIHFLPFQNQSIMPSVYAMADVVVLPSAGPNETWGLAVNEAMACNKPCTVSNKVGCYTDLINDKTGWIFESNNAQQLSNIISNLDKQTLQQMGNNAKQHIANWSYENICIAIENLLNKL